MPRKDCWRSSWKNLVWTSPVPTTWKASMTLSNPSRRSGARLVEEDQPTKRRHRLDPFSKGR
jgi:hypothetical protein